MKEYPFNFRQDGSWDCIHDPELSEAIAGLGPGRRTRASHVLPLEPTKQLAFRLLRRAFGDEGRVAAWTRDWKGPWIVDMAPSGGPVLGPYLTRTEALERERRWLLVNAMNCPDVW